MWTRKRTVIAGRTDGYNDWTVYRDRQRVARVYATMLPDAERSWMWFVQIGTPEQGYAESMEAALEQVRKRVG